VPLLQSPNNFLGTLLVLSAKGAVEPSVSGIIPLNSSVSGLLVDEVGN